MTSDKIAIQVSHLSKHYQIGGPQEPYHTFRDAIINSLKAPMKIFRRDPPMEGFWALKDVSFEVERGEVVGIIGRNGAGKSTLLKILSRITSPTKGTIELHGRVGSLLEVGTGFHPELTGRENIYLSGSILGMKRREIDAKLDEIVKFSEIEKFLDTPVKRYSSGMYVRLAFAVAAHLDPEILLVDEVLAVGDAAFQKKCLGKMGEVADEGRTILFVSHNMAAVQNLCQRCVVLEKGTVKFIGNVPDSISAYQISFANSPVSLMDRTDRAGDGGIRVTAIELRNINGDIVDTISCGETLDILLHFEVKPGFEKSQPIVSIGVKTQWDVPVFLIHNRMTGEIFEKLPSTGAFVCRISDLPLIPSVYKLDYSIIKGGDYMDGLTSAANLDVTSGNFYGTGEVPPASHGICLVNGHWRIET
jgi:lipopolysaccharide transport system ATP-binding protein